MHIVTIGPGGRACTLTQAFERAGLHRGDSPAVDLAKVERVLAGATSRDRSTRATVARALAGVCAAVTGITDPRIVVLGGTWGAHPALIDAVTGEVNNLARPVPVRAALVVADASHAGARSHAGERIRQLVTQYRTTFAELRPVAAAKPG
jgi:predicted NBD/HSP70 family sugar kinase